jgi:hypothetical protein
MPSRGQHKPQQHEDDDTDHLDWFHQRLSFGELSGKQPAAGL